MRDPEDRIRFGLALTALAEMYSRDLSEPLIEMYWRGLVPYSIEAVEDASARYMASPDDLQRMPRPGDLIRIMGGTTKDAALLAWTKVDRAVRTVGTWCSVVFDDPMIHRVISDMGGWTRFELTNEKEWPHVGREFENRYRALTMNRVESAYPSRLIGSSEAYNGQHGFEAAPLRVIGDIERARLTYAGGSRDAIEPKSAAQLMQSKPVARLTNGGNSSNKRAH
ncbi:DUF6475 domain-containing protein [Paraburkholderia kururiensis]|uniref:DUF6475 domain-containing protein n=1 Tax=Paraburkholderia kururiensis TaxID=984307 RepID=UPI0005A7534D|nr:DUF6475 domain-containing protein [Paraburkholderia kururiensis]